MTPSELLEYFRLHINDYITPPIDVHFSPKGDASNFTDSVRWNLPYSQALGALLHIDIPGPIGTSNDGSVVLSDYNSMINTFQHHYFKFSTLETYFDKEHPVAGNREFGIYNSSVNLTQFTFYTMGVDRTWDWITDLLAKYGFGKSDELWHNIQNNFKLFINHTGGQAVNFNPKSFTPRPNYQAIKDFLEGKIDKSELKTRLGC